jgi:single-stranded DNA-binding protein
MNSCTLVGALIRDPHTHFEGEGKQHTSFTLKVREAGSTFI